MKITSGTSKLTGKMVYLVQSATDGDLWHIVQRTVNGFVCDCKSFKYGRKGHCKHTNAVKMEICEAMAYLGAKWMPPMKEARKVA
jgi:hypothetical protein